MEYDAYHKLSLAKIDTADPVPQITDTDGFITTTINQIAQKLGGSFDVVLNVLPEVDKEYLKKKLLLKRDLELVRMWFMNMDIL